MLLSLLPLSVQAQCVTRRVAELPITLWQNKLYVPVTVNGSPRLFFVDTGAGVSAISEQTAAELNIPHDFDHTLDMFGVGGEESHLYIGQVDDLNLGGIAIKNRDFPVSAFGDLLADGEHRADGLIGADILSHFDVEIDIANRRLALWRVQGCTDVKPDWDGAASGVPMQIDATNHITVPVSIDESRLSLLLDTGAPGLLLTTRAAAQAGATPDILEENPEITGFGMNHRSYPARLHIFRRLQFGDQIYGNIRAVVVGSGPIVNFEDGLLGVQFLKRGRIWISYSSRTLFMQPAAAADE